MSAAFEVLEPGLLTTLQDLGRPGRGGSGVPIGGALDRFALSAGNLLLGNAAGAAALECTVRGPSLRALRDLQVAITGADFEVLLGGRPRAAWTVLDLREGDVLQLGRHLRGARAYLAVRGGLAGMRWLGSLSTYLLVGRGGIEGRALRAGDVLELAAGPEGAIAPGRELSAELRPDYPNRLLPVVAGPHHARLSAAARRALLKSEFTVLPESDRMGYRLAGPQLDIKSGELLSFGVTPGCLQLPASGPIMLMADHQTAGGYPVVASVPRSGLVVAAQLLPGDVIGFREVSVVQAQDEWRRLRSGLDSLRAPA